MASSPPPSSSSPLLHTKRGEQIISDFHGCSRLSFKEVIVEMKMLYTIAFPMIITGLLIYGKSLISMLFLGNLGKDALAGGSIAIAIANISGFSVIYGLALGMEPISSQAFGAKQWPLLSQTLQRTLLLLSLACIPISILWLNIQPFLLFFNQDSSISAVAAPYLAFSLPSLLFNPSSTPSRFTSEHRTSFPPSCLAPPSPSPSTSPPPTSSSPTSASVSLAWPSHQQLPTWPS